MKGGILSRLSRMEAEIPLSTKLEVVAPDGIHRVVTMAEYKADPTLEFARVISGNDLRDVDYILGRIAGDAKI